jgi:hypothetical protein
VGLGLWSRVGSWLRPGLAKMGILWVPLVMSFRAS